MSHEPRKSIDLPTSPLTVLYDGECPLCRREIAHAQGLANRRPQSGLSFVDISASGSQVLSDAPIGQSERARLLARFHVQRADGSRLDGAAAFVAMWERLPGWRWLAKFAKVPLVLPLLELGYSGFLRVRPFMQKLAGRLEPVTALGPHVLGPHILDPYLVRELRSDHAGETGAVFIYRGLSAVANFRKDAELLDFAQRHGQTEAEHLRLIEACFPSALRSRLLVPWRIAGWLTGAIPALFGRRAVYATIGAVETFVDQHYQAQIDYIQALNACPDRLHDSQHTELLSLLQQCQADELHHRDESLRLAGHEAPVLLRWWCWLVGVGSQAAVVLARRF